MCSTFSTMEGSQNSPGNGKLPWTRPYNPLSPTAKVWESTFRLNGVSKLTHIRGLCNHHIHVHSFNNKNENYHPSVHEDSLFIVIVIIFVYMREHIYFLNSFLFVHTYPIGLYWWNNIIGISNKSSTDRQAYMWGRIETEDSNFLKVDNVFSFYSRLYFHRRYSKYTMKLFSTHFLYPIRSCPSYIVTYSTSKSLRVEMVAKFVRISSQKDDPRNI